MSYSPDIVNRDGKDYIFCAWRRKYVRLTPEEWVRQHFLHALVEVSLTQKVFDQVAVYNRRLGVSFFFLSNGTTHYACRVLENSYQLLPDIPIYSYLCQNT